jgi:hypothetical protein
MKTDMKYIESEVSKTLESLDNIQKASPKPFLYIRIMARMEKAKEVSSGAYELKPVYLRIALASLAVLIVFNVFTVTLYLGSDPASTTEASQEEMYFDQYYPALTTIDNIEQNLTE